MNDQQRMYGVSDINAYFDNVTKSLTYKFSGANMVIAGLMSDAQEQMAFEDVEGARQTLNRAKAILFQVMDGKLNAAAPALQD